MMTYSLAVFYATPCIPINTMYKCHVLSVLLIVLIYAAIWVVYCHYMFTPFVECLWNVCGMLKFETFVLRSVNRMNNQRINYGTEDKDYLVQQIHVSRVISFYVRKTGPIHLVLVDLMAGWQVDSTCTGGFKNFKNSL